MEQQSSQIVSVDDSKKENDEKHHLNSESSSNSEYELVDNNLAENMEKTTPVLENNLSEEFLKNEIDNAMINSPSGNVVGKSIFYDCMDDEKSERKSLNFSDTDEDLPTYEIDPEYRNEGNFTIFSNVVYLGSTILAFPKSESEILHRISELNAAVKSDGVKVKISIPNCSDGQIILYHEDTDMVYSTFDIQKILFFAKGSKNTQDEACFAFSWTHGNSQENAIYQCHIFRCNIPEAVNPVNLCFTKAFKKPDNAMIRSTKSDNFTASDNSVGNITSAMYEFLVSLEIREKISKNSYTNVLREKSYFKIHQNCDKEICITVKQMPSELLPPLFIERCFGVLLSVGKIKKQADMLLLELQTSGSYLKGSPDFQIIAKWDLNEKAFESALNDSQKTHLITVAVDLVIKGIIEPVRFVIETQMKIDNSDMMQSSRFSNSFLFAQGNKRPLLKKFYIQLKENKDNAWILESVDPVDDIPEPVQSTFNQKIKNISKIVRSSSSISFDDDISCDDNTIPTDEEEDEPLASGTGEVTKESSVHRLELWCPVLSEWNSSGKRPKSLQTLVRNGGIPQALRCQLWQKLSRTEDKADLSDKYRILIAMESKCEDIISRDVYRTFPAHDLFQEKGGFGQEALYKVSKAYAVYDTEIGYCQGLSFIVATLLLQMPEEESFEILVAIMYDYGLRELYKQNFENLSLKLFQLTCLMRDQLPDLYEHFSNQQVEVHMFASQWFLTLFTQRFALPFVFQCIDLFLLDGITVLFQIAITLLHACKKVLLTKDFESILKYIRIQLPKKFTKEEKVAKFIKLASEVKIKKLKKYEEEYLIQKEENDRIEKILSQYQMKYHEDRKLKEMEIQQLHQRIKKLEDDKKTYESIIDDYKKITKRQERQIEELKYKTVHDNKSVSTTENQLSKDQENDVSTLMQRIKELEIDLVTAKVAQVEAESKLITQNQNAKQQQVQNNITNIKVPPLHPTNATSWKSKLENVVNSMNIPNMSMNIPTFQSHLPDLSSFSTTDDTINNKQ